MNMNLSAAAALLLALGAPAARLAAQGATAETGTIRGTVVDAASGEALEAAVVQLWGSSRLVRSDADGSFQLSAVPAGARILLTRRLGYAADRTSISVHSGDTTATLIRMLPVAATLGAVTVRPIAPERDEFERAATPDMQSISSLMVRSSPVAVEADVLRAVPLLPGIVARSDRSTGFSAEGGEEDQNLVLLDGIPIFNPDHFGGLFGTFIDGAVDRVELQQAGFPARYGGRMSSVLDVKSAEAGREGMHGSANLSLLSSSVVEGGAFAGGRGSWNVAGRRTYADLLARAFTKQSLPYHFYDLQAHGSYEAGTGTRVSVTAYRGLDVLDASMAELQDSTAPATARLLYDRGNDVAGLSLAQPLATGRGATLGDSVVAEQRFSLSRFGSTFDQGSGSLTFASGVRDGRIAGSIARYGATHVVRGGYDYDRYRVRYRLGSPQTRSDEFFADQPLSSIGFYAEDEWHATARLLVQPGLRWERVSATGWTGVSPRLSMKYFVTPAFAVTAAGGTYAQWLQLSTDETAPMQLFDYWVASTRAIPVAVAHHYTVAAERWFGDTRFARLEGYYKPYSGINAQNVAADPAVPSTAFLTERGTAYGATLLLRQEESGGVAGWLAYSYGFTTRRRGDTTFFPLQDRRHTLDAVATFRRKQTVYGVRFTYGSGTPFTPVVGEVQTRSYDPATGDWLPGDPLPLQGPYDSKRYPAYSRLDLSASRAYRWRGATLTPSLSVVNAYDRHNVFRYFTHYDTSPPTRSAVTQLPILPTLGLKVDF